MSVDPASPAANLTTVRPSRTTTGVIESFDADAGLGDLLGDDGERYRFQSIEIADGSRLIEVGAPVRFERFARYGQWQAGRITPRGVA